MPLAHEYGGGGGSALVVEGAACRGLDTNLFFPVPGDPHGKVPAAKAVCAGCPIREACLEFALEHPQAGVWGGLTAGERGRLTAGERGRLTAGERGRLRRRKRGASSSVGTVVWEQTKGEPMRTVQDAYAAIDALVLSGNNRGEDETIGRELKAFIGRQADSIRSMAGALATPSNTVDECSGEAAEIAARTATVNIVRCLEALDAHGPMIAERVAVVAGVKSAAKRLSDAFKAGWVEKVGKAPNADGRNANLYGITDSGRVMLGAKR